MSYDEDEWEKDHAPRPKRRDAPRTETNRQAPRKSSSSMPTAAALVVVAAIAGAAWLFLGGDADTGARTSSTSSTSSANYLPSSEAEREDLRRLMAGSLLCYNVPHRFPKAAYLLTSSALIGSLEQFRSHLEATNNSAPDEATLRRMHAVAKHDLVHKTGCAATALQARRHSR